MSLVVDEEKMRSVDNFPQLGWLLWVS